MKLELKHLAPYLPYNLHIWHENWKDIVMMDACGEVNETFSIMDVIEGVGESKPILKPLADLTKEIKHNEKKFVAWDELINKSHSYGYEDQMFVNELRAIRRPKGYDDVPHWMYQDLIKWHFDVFHLIDNGLAIDINTITKTKTE